MVYNNLVDTASSSISENISATTMNRENEDTRLNRDDNNNEARNEQAIEKYSHEAFDNLVQREENHPIIEFNGNFPQETGMKTSSHEDFEMIVQEEETRESIETNDRSPQETAFETYSHKDFEKLVEEEKTHQIIETNNDHPHESAIETYSHEAFDKLVQQEDTHQIIHQETATAIETYSHEDFDKLIREGETSRNNIDASAIETYSHEDFDKLIREGETSRNNIDAPAIESYSHEDFDKLIREGETSRNDISARVESAFESYSHQDFDNLIQEEETFENNIHAHVESSFESYTHQDQAVANHSYSSNENADKKFREEVTAHHTKTGSHNPADTRSQDPAPIATVSSLSSLTEDPVTVVTAPPLLRSGNAETSNIYQNPHLNNQITITYLAFVLIVAAVVAFFVAICMGRRRRSNRQKLEVYQYLGGFDIEDIDVRRSITGGWHGQYRNNLSKGLDDNSDFETYIDSDDGSRCSDSRTDEKTIVFLERGDLSSPMQSPQRSLPFTMLVADRNIYLDDPSEDADSDDEDVFSPVRTRPF